MGCLLGEHGVDLFLVGGQGGVDDLVHVVVLVGAQAAAEHGVGHGLLEFHVPGVQLPVCLGVDRVVRLVAALCEPAVLLPHHRALVVLGIAALGVEVLKLDRARVRHIRVGEVHHRASEMVVLVVADLLEVHRPPLQIAQRVVEVPVHRARVHHWHAGRVQRGLVVRLGCVEEVRVQRHGDARVVDHPLEPRRVPVPGQALPRVPEIPVVVVEPHRQAADDRRGQLAGVGLPLLARVLLDERLVQWPADQADALVVQVPRILPGQLARLLGDQSPGLLGRVVRAEELVDRAQVDRQRIHLPLVRGVHAVHVAREPGEPVDVLPHPRVARMEQVRPVLVDLRPGLLVEVRVRVTPDMIAHVDDTDARPGPLHRLLRHRQTEQARAHHHQIRIVRKVSHI